MTASEAKQISDKVYNLPENVEFRKKFLNNALHEVLADIKASAENGYDSASISQFYRTEVFSCLCEKLTELGYKLAPSSSSCGGITKNFEIGAVCW